VAYQNSLTVCTASYGVLCDAVCIDNLGGHNMNHHQHITIINAYKDLERCIKAIDSEDLAELLIAREHALCALVDLARDFPATFGAKAVDEARAFRDGVAA